MTLGEKIKKLRKSQNLTQEQLAQICHMERRCIWGYEHGKTIPTTKTLLILAEKLGCSVSYLIENEPKNKENIDSQSAADDFITVLKSMDHASSMKLLSSVITAYSTWLSEQESSETLEEDGE